MSNPYLVKESDNIIIRISNNGSLYKTKNCIYRDLVNIKKIIHRFNTNCKKFFISSPLVRTYELEVINILKGDNNILKHKEINLIFLNNISVSHLYMNGLYLNLNDRSMLAENILLRIHTFWNNVNSNKEINLSNDHNGNHSGNIIISSSGDKSRINYNSTIQLGSAK